MSKILAFLTFGPNHIEKTEVDILKGDELKSLLNITDSNFVEIDQDIFLTPCKLVAISEEHINFLDNPPIIFIRLENQTYTSISEEDDDMYCAYDYLTYHFKKEEGGHQRELLSLLLDYS